MGGLCGRAVPSVSIVRYSRGCSGRLDIFALLFHWQYILLFPMLRISIPTICFIPFEDCLERRCLFRLHFSPVEIAVGHRQSSRRHLAPPVVAISHLLC